MFTARGCRIVMPKEAKEKSNKEKRKKINKVNKNRDK